MKPSIFVTVAAIAFATTGCQKAATAAPAPATPIGEAEAAKMADATVAAWTSMDAARIKALYAPTIVGFDFAVAPLATDRAAWDKAQDMFASAKLDSAEQKERKIQILGPDVFVVSGTWDVKSSTMPANNSTVRCTDVYQKDGSGAWPIVNEHCSAAPTPA